MKTTDLPENSAIVVETKGITQIKEGDVVLVGVRAYYDGTKFIPLNKRLSLVPDLFDDIKGDELIILKRHQP